MRKFKAFLNFKELKAEFFLVLAVIFWGTTFPLMKMVLSDISPITLIFIRFVIATIFFYILFRKSIIFSLKELFYGFLIGIPLFLGYIFQIFGLQYTTASKSGFITGIAIIIAPFLSFLFLKEKIKRAIFALPIAFIGIYFLSFGFNRVSFVFLKGDFLTLLGAIVFAFQILFVHMFSSKKNFFSITFFELFFVFLFSAPFFVKQNPQTILDFKAPVFFILFYSAIFTTVLTLFLQNKYQADVSVLEASIIYAFEPVFASLFAFILIKEVITLNIIVGGALIFIATIVSAKR